MEKSRFSVQGCLFLGRKAGKVVKVVLERMEICDVELKFGGGS
jgi:hypothetical protein